MKVGDKIYDKARGRYGVVTGLIIPESIMRTRTPAQMFGELSTQELLADVREVRYQPYQDGKPVGMPTVAEVTQIILLLWSIWEPLVAMYETVRDWVTPDPERVAARVEARRIRREARKHLPK